MAHWDAQGNSAFMIKLDLDGSSNAAPPGGKATVELQIPRMQWLLPHRTSPAPPVPEGEEAPAAAEEGGEGEGDHGKGRKMELMKPSIDVKYISGWSSFVPKMTEFVFFHNPGAYTHTSALEISAAAAAPAEDAAAGEGGEVQAEEAAGEGGAPEEKPKTKAGISALFVENTSQGHQDVLLCLWSTCMRCTMTVQQLNIDAWALPAASDLAAAVAAAEKAETALNNLDRMSFEDIISNVKPPSLGRGRGYGYIYM